MKYRRWAEWLEPNRDTLDTLHDLSKEIRLLLKHDIVDSTSNLNALLKTGQVVLSEVEEELK